MKFDSHAKEEFEDQIRDQAWRLGFSANFVYPTNSSQVVRIVFERSDNPNIQYSYGVNFDEVDNLTSAAVPIFVDLNLRYKLPSTTTDYNKMHYYTKRHFLGFNDRLESDIRKFIKKVIFNPPATVVLWIDGTKTVVKAQGDNFDSWTGLAMAISKKALGNKGNYFEVFKKWCEPYEDKQKNKKPTIEDILEYVKNFGEAFGCTIDDGTIPKEAACELIDVPPASEPIHPTWKIYYKLYFPETDRTGFYEHPYEYKHKSSAIRAAKKMYGGTKYEWVVAQENPWSDKVDDAE